MKRFLRILRNIFLTLFSLLLFLMLGLYLYYNHLDRNFLNETNARSQKPKAAFYESPVNIATASQKVINLLPYPQKLEIKPGIYSFPEVLNIESPEEFKQQLLQLSQMAFPGKQMKTGAGGITVKKDSVLGRQAYTLNITPRGIAIACSTREGLHYAITTLKVLNRTYAGKIPCLLAEDKPDLEVRGVMLDISRDKVPSVETLKLMIAYLADLKYNQVQLYVEGFSFAYPSFKHLWKGRETPLTPFEIQELDKFCNDRCIDLVPNHNVFGHMAAWLATPEYKDLAECPDGYMMLGIQKVKTTIDPSDPRSLKLAEQMTADLLPNFTSGYINFNLDEPFELGKGKSEKIVKERGVGPVYLDYTMKMHHLASRHNKKMMMWGDIILKHPEIISKIPKDITVLDWGYESSYPFEKNGRLFKRTGLDYYVCPGTSSWTTLTGRTENMLGNILNATSNAVKYGAKGMLITDWGDMGHWQYLPVSYAGFATGAALSWNYRSSENLPLESFLDSYVFRDKAFKMGKLALHAGKYNRFEEFEMVNMTTANLAFQFGIRDKVMIDAIFKKVLEGVKELMMDIDSASVQSFMDRYYNRGIYDYQGLTMYLSDLESELGQVKLDVPDSALIRAEYANAFDMIRLGAGIKQYIETKDTIDAEKALKHLGKMKGLCEQVIEKHQKLWLSRNKEGGLMRSLTAMTNLKNKIESEIALHQKSVFSKRISRFFEKIASAAIVLYFKIS